MKTAIILGATGLTGGLLLNKLLSHPDYDEVKVFSRRSTGLRDKKLQEYIVDLEFLHQVEEKFVGDELFCCIGSTQKKTPDFTAYRKVDYGIPVSAAKLAKENRVPKMLVVSALGASPESRFFYNRTKGEMERDVIKDGPSEVYFFQPSLISGYREENRPFEKWWKRAMKIGDHLLLGPLRKYRSIPAETIVNAMIYVAKHGHANVKIPSDEIKHIAHA